VVLAADAFDQVLVEPDRVPPFPEARFLGFPDSPGRGLPICTKVMGGVMR
jgi:hypothetical protein